MSKVKAILTIEEDAIKGTASVSLELRPKTFPVEEMPLAHYLGMYAMDRVSEHINRLQGSKNDEEFSREIGLDSDLRDIEPESRVIN